MESGLSVTALERPRGYAQPRGVGGAHQPGENALVLQRQSPENPDLGIERVREGHFFIFPMALQRGFESRGMERLGVGGSTHCLLAFGSFVENPPFFFLLSSYPRQDGRNACWRHATI